MPLGKKAAPAKATAKAAPAKKAVAPKRRVVKQEEPEEEPEPEEETEVETEEEVISEGVNEIKVLIRASQNFTYENGCLDSRVAEATVTIDADMSIDQIDAEMNRGRVLVALGIGAEFVQKEGSVLIGMVTPVMGTTTRGGSSGGAKAKSSAAPAKKSGGGGRSGGSREAHYTKAEVTAMWMDYAGDPDDDGDAGNPDDYWDNLDHGQYPNIKPKEDSLEDIAERTGEAGIGEKEAKPLYTKTAPKWVQDQLN